MTRRGWSLVSLAGLFAACAVALVVLTLAAVMSRGPEREDER